MVDDWICVSQMVSLPFNTSKPCFTFKKLNGNPQLYLLIPLGFVCARMISMTATLPSTMSQLTLVRHFKYLQSLWDRGLEQCHSQYIRGSFKPTHSLPQLKSLQGTQNVRRTCTNLTYTIMSRCQTEEMIQLKNLIR